MTMPSIWLTTCIALPSIRPAVPPYCSTVAAALLGEPRFRAGIRKRDCRARGGPKRGLNPCESSAVPVRAVGRKCLETRSVCGAAATCLRSFVKRRTNPAQVCSIFDQEVRRDRMSRPARSRGIDARAMQGARCLVRTAAAGPRRLPAEPARALRLLQRFAVLGQIEAFDLVLLAHPQRQEESDRLEKNVGQHAGPDEDCDDGVELDQHLPGIAF